MRRTLILWQAGVLLVLMSVIGCSTSDDRLVELSEEAMKRQAEQNRQIAQQSQQVAEAAHELVQADAQSRKELFESQRSLEAGIQAERLRLDEERHELERDRQALAVAKIREPIVAATIWSAAVFVAVVLPLVLCIYLVRNLGSSEPSQNLTELLVHELTSPQPTLLPPIPADLPSLDRGQSEPSCELPA